jgi:hypothetical protein
VKVWYSGYRHVKWFKDHGFKYSVDIFTVSGWETCLDYFAKLDLCFTLIYLRIFVFMKLTCNFIIQLQEFLN